MRELIEWSGALCFGLLLGPPVLLLLVGLVFELLDQLNSNKMRREGWRDMLAELKSGTSPLHRWVASLPPPLLNGLITVQHPEQVEVGRWRVGHVEGEAIDIVNGDGVTGVDLQIGGRPQDAWYSPEGPWLRLAQRVLERHLHMPLEAAEGDAEALEALCARLDALLWAPLKLPWPLAQGGPLPALYRAVEAFIPAHGLLDALSEDTPEALCAEAAAALNAAGWDTQGWSTEHLPPGDWRAANRLAGAQIPAEEDLDNPHWADDPDETEVLLFADGPRTLALRLNVHEGLELIELYESPADFIARGVLPRVAQQMEARMQRGGGWTPRGPRIR